MKVSLPTSPKIKLKYFMKTKFTLSILALTFLLFNSCEKNKVDIKSFTKIHDYNVLIVPDLSNRINKDIHPKPVNDTLLINNIIGNIEPLLQTNNRQMNQLDVYKLDFINRGILNKNVVDPKDLEINFKKFENNLSASSEYKRKGLKSDVLKFKSGVSKIYNYSLQNSSGSDVWNYFNETIKSSIINNPDKIDSTAQTIKNTKNIVVLFTDGYIESTNNDLGYTLNQQLIKKIRTEFLNSKSTDLEKFISSKPEYLIKKTSNNLHDINILILEMVDRSLDKNGSTTIQPTDFEIMKIIWTKWLKDSGASHVEIYPAFSKETDSFEALEKFMKEIK